MNTQNIPVLQKDASLYKIKTIGFLPGSAMHITSSAVKALTKGRIYRDILRTLSHEWVHEYQRDVLKWKHGPDIGGRNEDMANSEAGALMKMFERLYPGFEDKMYE